MVLSKLFIPLSPEERKLLPDATERLLANEDFQFFMRDIFEKSNPLSPVFLDKYTNDPNAAAKADGEKNFSRLIVKLYLQHQNGTKKIKKARQQAG